MHNSRLFRVLAVLESHEWVRLKRKVDELYGPSADDRVFFEFLYSDRKCLDDQRFVLESFRQARFPHMSRKALLNMMSRIYQLVEHVLVTGVIISNPFLKQVHLITTLNERGLYELANQKARKCINDMERGTSINLEDALLQWQLWHVLYFSDNPIKYRAGATLLKNLVSKFSELSANYSFFYQAELINWSLLTGEDFSVEEAQLRHQSDSPNQTELTIILDALVWLQRTDDDAYFDMLYQALTDVTRVFSKELRNTIFFHLIKAGTRRVSQGRHDVYETITKLYEWGLEYGSFLNGKYIPVVRFYNIIDVLQYILSEEEMMEFITRHIHLVIPDERRVALASCRARVLFTNGHYAACVKMLRTVSFSGFRDVWNEKRFTVMAHFASEEEEELTLLLASNLRRFIRKHRRHIGKKNYLGSLNLMDYIIASCRGVAYSELDKRLEKYDYLMHRRWLEEFHKKKAPHL